MRPRTHPTTPDTEALMNNDKITIYEKPTCSTCRQVNDLLRAGGMDYERVNYVLDPIGELKLRELIGKLKTEPRQLLRTKEPLYRELNPDGHDLSADEIIALLVAHPTLLQRPIAERGDRAVLARPPERIKEIMSDE